MKSGKPPDSMKSGKILDTNRNARLGDVDKSKVSYVNALQTVPKGLFSVHTERKKTSKGEASRLDKRDEPVGDEDMHVDEDASARRIVKIREEIGKERSINMPKKTSQRSKESCTLNGSKALVSKGKELIDEGQACLDEENKYKEKHRSMHEEMTMDTFMEDRGIASKNGVDLANKGKDFIDNNNSKNYHDYANRDEGTMISREALVDSGSFKEEAYKKCLFSGQKYEVAKEGIGNNNAKEHVIERDNNVYINVEENNAKNLETKGRIWHNFAGKMWTKEGIEGLLEDECGEDVLEEDAENRGNMKEQNIHQKGSFEKSKVYEEGAHQREEEAEGRKKEEEIAGHIKSTTVDEDEMRKSEEWLERHALIGHLQGPRPPVTYIENWMWNVWGKKGIVVNSYRFLRKGYILFLIDTEDMVNRIFSQGLWTLRNQPLYLERWSPCFSPDTPRPTTAPVWVELPDLPFSLFNQVKSICAPLGRFLGQEKEGFFNPRGSPMVCIMIDLNEELPKQLRIERKDGTVVRMQEVVYKNLPNSCFFCGLADHRIKDCPSKKPKPIIKKTERRWIPKKEESNKNEFVNAEHLKSKAAKAVEKNVFEKPKKVSKVVEPSSMQTNNNNPFASLWVDGGEDDGSSSMDDSEMVPLSQEVNMNDVPNEQINYGYQDDANSKEEIMPLQTSKSPQSTLKYKRRLSMGVRKSFTNLSPGGKKQLLVLEKEKDEHKEEGSLNQVNDEDTSLPKIKIRKKDMLNYSKWEEDLRREVSEEDDRLAAILASPMQNKGQEVASTEDTEKNDSIQSLS